MPGDWLVDLLQDWRSFDVAAAQDRLDALTHLRAEVDGQVVHLVHAASTDPAAPVLLLTHGWPGSFLEHLPLLPLLTDSFTVVMPSLPGFGFSAPAPVHGFTSRAVAALWHRLVTEGLGAHRYVAHGSDLGAGVTGWLARDYPDSIDGVHLATPGLAPAPAPRTDAEVDFAREVERWTAEEGGYAHQQATKPATLGAALHDSPAGLAAWIGEPADAPPPTPTAITVFGGEAVPFPKPPRALAQRYYNVTSWAQHQIGGHFPGVAEPGLLAHTLRDTLRPATFNAGSPPLAQADERLPVPAVPPPEGRDGERDDTRGP